MKINNIITVVNDRPEYTEILAGMWGCRNGILKGIRDMIFNYDMRDYDQAYQNDQNFLREVVYPMVKDKAFVHDPYFSIGHEFPTAREDAHDFVGNVYDENEVPQF
jgi:hypothetical protein